MNEKCDLSDKDMPSAFLSACLWGDGKSLYLRNKTDKYYDKLNQALYDKK